MEVGGVVAVHGEKKNGVQTFGGKVEQKLNCGVFRLPGERAESFTSASATAAVSVLATFPAKLECI